MKKLEQHIDNNVCKFYHDNLYFLKYEGEILFFENYKLKEHIYKEDVINNFMKIICADYISTENIHNLVFWKNDLEQMFEDFELDKKYIKNLTVKNRYSYITTDLEISPDYYSFYEVSELLFENYFKHIVEIIKI